MYIYIYIYRCTSRRRLARHLVLRYAALPLIHLGLKAGGPSGIGLGHPSG